MNLHKEISFETEVCEYLAGHGWLYSEGDTAQYDRALALIPVDVLTWVQEAQPKAWDALRKNHGAHAGNALLARLSKQLNTRGMPSLEQDFRRLLSAIHLCYAKYHRPLGSN